MGGREEERKGGKVEGREGRRKEVSNCSHMKLFRRALLISIPPAFQPAEKYIDINCAGATAEFYCSSATKAGLRGLMHGSFVPVIGDFPSFISLPTKHYLLWEKQPSFALSNIRQSLTVYPASPRLKE